MSKNKLNPAPALKAYVLYEFVDQEDGGSPHTSTKKIKEIDFSPRDWVFYDDEAQEMVTVFMEPPYTPDNQKLLQDMVKQQAPPPYDWPTYPIIIRGHAATYTEAQHRLKILEKEKYVYTTGGETDGEAKSIAIERKIRSNPRCEKIKSIRNSLPAVPNLDDTIKEINTGEIEYSGDSEHESEEESPSTVPPPKKKAKLIPQKVQQSKCINKVKKNFKEYASELASQQPQKNKIQEKRTQQYGAVPSTSFEQNPIFTHEKQEIQDKKLDKLLILANKNHIQLQEVLENQRILSAKLEGTVQNQASSDFASGYNVQLPFENYADFQEFEQNLVADKEFRDAFMASLVRYNDPGRKTRKTINNILKAYFAKNVALQFVAAKKTVGKYVFKETRMYQCMRAEVTLTHKEPITNLPISEIYFLRELGTVLPNVKDWDGGRIQRQRSI